MPGFDGTGPRGMGPMTGGGRGFCSVPFGRAGYAGAGFYAPYAASWGMPYYGVPPFTQRVTREEEVSYLKGLAQSMRNDLEEIEARISELSAEKE